MGYKSTANIIVKGKNLKAFPLRSGIRQGYLLLTHLFHVVLVAQDRAIRQVKEIEASKSERKKEYCYSLQMTYYIEKAYKLLQTLVKLIQQIE